MTKKVLLEFRKNPKKEWKNKKQIVMRKTENLLFAALLAIGLTACSSNNGSDSPSSNEMVMHVQLHPDTWTYISLSKGTTVGTSELGDAETDKLWYDRTDWDVALCNGAIRTNGGTSGKGKGAIMSMPQSFDNVAPSAITSFHADVDTVTIAIQK